MTKLVNISYFKYTIHTERRVTLSGRRLIPYAGLLNAMVIFLIGTACGGGAVETDTITMYSGRGEELVKPIIEQFTSLTGIRVEVRWGGTAELAATILEEGDNSPADIFYAQDPGALGALEGMLARLPTGILETAGAQFRSPDGRWVGVSGRARTVVYNTERVTEDELPESIWGFVEPQWLGSIGWAPTNVSFLVMMTVMRYLWGEDRTRLWLDGIMANDPQVYPKNSPIVQAVGAGEVDVGFVNHYYLLRTLQEDAQFPAGNYHTRNGDPGALIMVSGVGILATSENQEAALKLVEFLLSEVGQQYFASQTFEYPVVQSVTTHPALVPLSEIDAPAIELRDLADLEGTLDLPRDAGVL